MGIERITTTQLKILNALATYKYLTPSLISRVTGIKYQSNISKELTNLAERSYTSKSKRNCFTEEIHYIKNKKAMKSLDGSLEVENIHYATNIRRFTEYNYPHTINSINCQITLYKSCKEIGLVPVFYYREIDFVGNMRKDKNLKSATQITTKHNWTLQPDAIFKLKSDSERMYLFEYERRGRSNIKDIFEKIHKHTIILNEGYIKTQFDYKFGHRILFVFEEDSTMKGAMEYCKTIEGSTDWFFFRKSSSIIPTFTRVPGSYIWEEADYFEGWLDCNGNSRNILH